MSRATLRLWLRVCVYLAILAGARAAEPLRVAILSDTKTRMIEELLLPQMQGTENLSFFERTQLPGLLEEFSLQALSAKAGWSACDVLILLNSFTGQDARKPELVVRVLSTHDLKIMGLWIYPLVADDPAALAERLGARLGPLLTDSKPRDERVTISLALLKTDSPRHTRLIEPFTYRLAARLQAYPGVGLIERWNVKDPSFEKWLRQTQPSDIRPPDYLVGGSITEQDSQAGLRLQINGVEKIFAPPADATDRDAVIAAAAQAIVLTRGTAPPTTDQEIRRQEQDARWFWKWSLFEQAAAAADTALYLGSQNPETAHIRALANLNTPPAGYVSNLPYAQTPTDEAFARALYGLECFLKINPPGSTAPAAERFRYWRYSEQALDDVGALLQALYFSRETLPGTALEQDLLREMAETFTKRIWTFYTTSRSSPQAYTPLLERVDYYGSNRNLPVSLLSYGAFLISDPAQLTELYIACLEEIGRQQNNDPTSPALTQIAGQRISLHHPWFAAWSERGPDTKALAKSIRTLTEHPKAEIRVFASLMPFRQVARPKTDQARYAATWWVWLSHRLATEDDFLARHPTAHSRALLAFAGLLAREHREQLKEHFPEADWRRCLVALKAKTPAGGNAEYAKMTARFLTYLIEESEENTLATPVASPEPGFEEVLDVFRYLTVASTPLDNTARAVNSRETVARTDVWLAKKAPAAATAPRLGIDSVPRPIVRSSLAGASGTPGAVALDQLDFGEDLGSPISVSQDDSGHLWLMFWHSQADLYTWLELDRDVTTVLRRVRLENIDATSFNYGYDVFGVLTNTLYFASYKGIYVIDIGLSAWRVFEVDKMGQAAVWLGRKRIWVTGQPGLIYEYHPESQQLALVSSAMRVPATNRLDGRDTYSITSMFEDGDEWYAWIDAGKLYKRDDTASDWRELYHTRRHWTPGQSYPTERLLRGLGSGRSMRGLSESFLAVLMLDQRMNGTMADRFVQMPFTADRPDGSRGGLDEASFLADRLWMLLPGRDNKPGLGAIRRGTGETSHHPLPVNGNSRLYAFETGFFIPSATPKGFNFLPRERVDSTYVPPATRPPIAAVPVDAVPNVPAAILPSPIRTFTSPSGRTIRAEVLGFPNEQVTLRREDGQVTTTDLRKFSAEDAAYLIDLKKRFESPAKP